MTTLRKACRKCTISKRKCIIQSPKCVRCLQKDLECVYDLEHLQPQAGSRATMPNFVWNPSNCDSPGYCVMKPLGFRSSTIDPAVCAPGHVDSLEVIRVGFLSVPELVQWGKPGVFVHPKLQTSCKNDHLDTIAKSKQEVVSFQIIQSFVGIDIGRIPLGEALIALQTLLIHLAAYFLSPMKGNSPDMELFLKILHEWTQTVYSSAQVKIPQFNSPWQKWLFGESIRRTILMSYILSLAINGFNKGYCSKWLFVESLPFDARPGLWMAQTPQAWIAAAKVKTGNEVGERLNSFHEFAEGAGHNASDTTFFGDTFLSLLVSAHNGTPRGGGN